MGNLGKRLITSLVVYKDTSVLTSNNISESDLFDDGLKTYKWANEYFNTHKEWPNKRMIEESTGVALPDEVDPLPYIANKVRERTLAKFIERRTILVAKALEDRKPDEADRIIKETAKESRIVTAAKVTSYRADAEDRIAEYDAAKLSGGYLGVSTPWASVNKVIQGWVNGTLNVVTAAQNTGKTWFLIICAEHAFNLGKKVLFVTLEMPTSRITRRMDAVRYKIPFANLRDLTLDDETDAKLKVLIRADRAEGDILFADKTMVKTVRDVENLVHSFEPDIVFIDGGYRFVGEKRSDWESSKVIVADLQTASELSDIPWIVTTQQGDSNETGKAPKKGPKMRAWGVRYAKEWVINPDVVLGLYQDADLRLMEKSDIYYLKIREGVGGISETSSIQWNMTKMEFKEFDESAPSSLVSY